MKKLLQLSFLFISMFAVNAQAQERITLDDGSVLNVFMVEPGEATSEPKPLVVLMGGGPGNASISRDTSQWLGSGFAQRGWLVAVPISPNNRSFRGSTNNQIIVQLIKELQKREDVRSGKVLLAGVSNGGMSSLEIARRNPEKYFGVAAIPAISSENTKNDSLKGFPVYLRIGGADSLGWADQFDSTVESLSSAGVELNADILDGAPHMFRMDWSTLGPWLEEIR